MTTGTAAAAAAASSRFDADFLDMEALAQSEWVASASCGNHKQRRFSCFVPQTLPELLLCALCPSELSNPAKKTRKKRRIRLNRATTRAAKAHHRSRLLVLPRSLLLGEGRAAHVKSAACRDRVNLRSLFRSIDQHIVTMLHQHGLCEAGGGREGADELPWICPKPRQLESLDVQASYDHAREKMLPAAESRLAERNKLHSAVAFFDALPSALSAARQSA